MLLRTLEIKSETKLIRKIEFKAGVNIITDETPNLKTSTGNSIGKTTVLRLIDYCLGSDGEDLFKDKEFKTEDENLVNELSRLGYYVELYFQIGRKIHRVSRSLTNKRVIYLNDNENTITELRQNLEKMIFGINTSKPSIRQLMPKFIRKDVNSMSNTLNYLHSTTSRDEYEMIFLFLFGFKDIENLYERFQSLSSIKKLKSKLRAIKGIKSLPTLKQAEKVLLKDIKVAEAQIKSFKISEAYEKEFDLLKVLRESISSLSMEKSSVELKLTLSKKTLAEIKESASSIDSAAVKAVYSQAKKFNPEIQKSFEDVLVFHNTMVKNKEAFVAKSIDALVRRLKEIDKNLKEKIQSEEKIIKMLSDTGSLADLQVLQKELNNLYEKLGNITTNMSLINDLEESVEEHAKKVNDINLKIDDYFQDYDNKLADFNGYFTKLSKELYKEEFLFTYDPNEKNGTRELTFKIANISSNEGGGKKKGQVAAFDLAYIPFSIEAGIKGPKFVMHDSIEDVHTNQIETLLKIANTFENGQYIVAVLKDKIQPLGEEWIKQHRILKLSQSDKLFKLL